MPNSVRTGLPRRSLLPAIGALAAAGRPAAADTWPSRPVKLIVGYPAGASTDLCARILAEDLRGRLGQPVVVENRPGANGSLGAAAVAAAPPDGHTLLVSNTSTMTVNHLLYRDIRYHPLRDLLPVASITVSPFILAINPGNPRTRPVHRLADLVALAKARPGGITYGSAGNGNLQHLNMELFSSIAGIRLLHVPYRGAALAQNALVAGEVDVVLETPSAGPLFQSAVLTPLASTGATRWRDLPEVPTVVESGYADFIATFWNGLVAPANTPPPIVERLRQAVAEAVEAPATRRLFLAQGDVVVLDPVSFRARIAEDIERNAAVIRSAGIEMQ
jgi:tripartite-type tricarboxylate transporter receptor subunit TctC